MKRLQALFTLPVISIFGLALIVRVTYNYTVGNGYFPLHDSLTYQTIAYNIIREHCFCYLPHLPTVDRAPLWPTMIAAIYSVVGGQDRVVRIFLSFVGSGTCTLIYFFSKDLFGRRIGIIAGLAAALYPFLFIYDGWLYSESLYIFLLFAFCYTLYHLQRSPHLDLMIISGLLLGLLSLTRPNGLLLLGLFIVWAVIIGWAKLIPWRKAIQVAMIVSVISLILVVPWTIRNFMVSHAFIPVAVGDGKVLLGAYNDDVANPSFQTGYYFGGWLRPEESLPSEAQRFPSQTCAATCEVARDSTFKADALQWISQHISSMPMLIGLHAANMWAITSDEADFPFNRYHDRRTSHLLVLMMEVTTPIVFALAAFGLIVTLKRWRELLFVYFMIALTFAQCIILYGIPRFRAPIEPMLILLAAGGVWWLMTQFSSYRKVREQEEKKHEDKLASISGN